MCAPDRGLMGKMKGGRCQVSVTAVQQERGGIIKKDFLI